jgi:hypothetical protein
MALTSLGGCGSAKLADWTPLEGYRKVYLLPDKDKPGENYARDVYQSLTALKSPPEVNVLHLPDLPDKGDIVDWLQTLAPDWNGYEPFPDKGWARTEFKTLLKKVEAVPEEWAFAGSEDPKSQSLNAGKKPLNVVDIKELLLHTFPRRESILSPVFNLASINMIFSRRGVGKTHAALGIAYAAASGGAFWIWTATRPFKTLFIDGEMPGEALQARLAAIVNANEKEPPEGYFKTITIDMNDGRMPDLSCLDGQIEIEEACTSAELIVLDNLSCLCRSGRENEAESWLSIGEWAMRMRSLGKCVIFIHHAGKDGNQRGTSKREDILDIVIDLKRPTDYEPEQGARFIVYIPKARHLSGSEAQSFEASLSTIDGERDGGGTVRK